MTFVPALRRLVHELSPDVAVAEEQAMASHLNELTGAQRTSAFVTMALAVLAILLLAIGCVALFTGMVRDSRNEIAIRMALGATNAKLTARIVAQGLLLTTTGVLFGLVGSAFISQRMSDQLYRVPSSDPAILSLACSVVLMIGLVSVYWSARLATRTDPGQSLRCD